MTVNLTVIQQSAQRLFPDQTLDQVLAKLLLEHAQKNLIKYSVHARTLTEKYNQSFESFRQSIMQSEPPFDVEQDYFAWELAVTGVIDMEDEIKRLSSLVQAQ